jgi:hypothetical protein
LRSIDSASFQEVDEIHDGVLFSPGSESGHLQLLFEGGLDDMAALSCDSSSNIGHIVSDCIGDRLILDSSCASRLQTKVVAEFPEVYKLRSAYSFILDPYVHDLFWDFQILEIIKVVQ